MVRLHMGREHSEGLQMSVPPAVLPWCLAPHNLDAVCDDGVCDDARTCKVQGGRLGGGEWQMSVPHAGLLHNLEAVHDNGAPAHGKGA